MSENKLKITTNSLPNSRIAVELEVPAERCRNSYNEAISHLSKTARLPGFRKGKVPKIVILQQIGTTRIQASALEKLLQKSWEEALEKENIEPLCEPILTNGFEDLLANFNPEKALKIILETDVAPSPTLKATKGLTAEAEKVTFDPKKIDDLIEQSRKQLATLVPVENRTAQMGDLAVVSFKGTYQDTGSSITGGSSESMDLELEKGRMIPGFIEGIIGMKINNEKSINCEFPQDYHQEDSRGRKAIFIVTLKDLKTRELPDLDDAFAKQASDKNNMFELRNDLEEKLRLEAQQKELKNRQDSLVNALVKELEVEIPKTLIDLESKNIVEKTARNFAQQGIDIKSVFTDELVQSLMNSSQKEAENNLRRNLALNALSKQENIDVSEEEIHAKLKEVKLELSNKKNIDENRLKQVISDDLLQEKLLKWLDENNTVIEIIPSKEKTSKQKNSKTKQSLKENSKDSKESIKNK